MGRYTQSRRRCSSGFSPATVSVPPPNMEWGDFEAFDSQLVSQWPDVDEAYAVAYPAVQLRWSCEDTGASGIIEWTTWDAVQDVRDAGIREFSTLKLSARAAAGLGGTGAVSDWCAPLMQFIE